MARENLRYFVLKTNRFWPFRILYKAIYLFTLKLLVLYFQRMPEIEAIYLRGSLTSSDWSPGASDIDLTVIIKDISIEDEICFLNKFWTTINLIAKFLPFFRNDAIILTVKEFSEQNFCKGYKQYFIGTSIAQWKLLSGKELRTFKEEPHPVFDIPISFHFSYWYREIFNYFYNQPYKKRDFLRPYYKMLLKVLGPLYAYETGKIPDLSSAIFEHFEKKEDPHSYKLIQELKTLEKNGYWSNEPSKVVPFYLYCITKIVDVFYRQLFKSKHLEESMPYEISPLKQENILPSHISEPLATFIKKLSFQSDSIKSIIFASAGEIHIILKQDFNFESFKLIINSVKEQLPNLTMQKIVPFIFTEDIFFGKLYFLAEISTIDYFYIITEAQTLFGENVIEKLKKPPDELIHKKFAELAFWVKYIQTKWLFRSQTATDFGSWWFYELLDKRLKEEKGFIALTHLQTESEYVKNYRHEEETKLFIKFHDDLLKQNITIESKKNLYRFTKFILKKLGY